MHIGLHGYATVHVGTCSTRQDQEHLHLCPPLQPLLCLPLLTFTSPLHTQQHTHSCKRTHIAVYLCRCCSPTGLPTNTDTNTCVAREFGAFATCVCICVLFQLVKYVHTYTHAHLHTHAHTDTHTDTHTHTYTHIHIHRHRH